MESHAIDMKKLERFAKAIAIMCNGECGYTYVIPKENKVFVCLGDSNPFEEEMLIQYMKDAIAKDYEKAELIDIQVENEGLPDSDGWYEFDGDSWIPYEYEE